jgi:hypothetical protein
MRQRSHSFFCDALPPPVLIITPSNWVPTLEYTVHFWGHPAAAPAGADSASQGGDCPAAPPGAVHAFDDKLWLRCRMTTKHVRNSVLFTDAEVWGAEGGGLLASSRQLARVLTPRGAAKAIGQQEE